MALAVTALHGALARSGPAAALQETVAPVPLDAANLVFHGELDTPALRDGARTEWVQEHDQELRTRLAEVAAQAEVIRAEGREAAGALLERGTALADAARIRAQTAAEETLDEARLRAAALTRQGEDEALEILEAYALQAQAIELPYLVRAHELLANALAALRVPPPLPEADVLTGLGTGNQPETETLAPTLEAEQAPASEHAFDCENEAISTDEDHLNPSTPLVARQAPADGIPVLRVRSWSESEYSIVLDLEGFLTLGATVALKSALQSLWAVEAAAITFTGNDSMRVTLHTRLHGPVQAQLRALTDFVLEWSAE